MTTTPRGRSRSPAHADPLQGTPRRAPAFVAPMECTPVADLPDDPSVWLYEVKLDGYRCCAVVGAAGRPALYSRSGNLWSDRFLPIREALGRVGRQLVLDGEVVALGEAGRPDFQELQNWQRTHRPIVFYAFDITNLDGRDLRQLPLVERRAILLEAARAFEPPLLLAPALEANLPSITAELRKLGLEGIVAKRRSSTYAAGVRSTAWLKHRFNDTAEFIVGGYIGGDANSFRLLVGVPDGKRLRFVKKLKNGFTPYARQQALERLSGLVTSRNPFNNLPEPKGRGAVDRETMKQVTWVRPELKVEVEFVEWTAGGKLRHAAFRKFSGEP
jgi:bifunctional non-homologous end joining protein LigD